MSLELLAGFLFTLLESKVKEPLKITCFTWTATHPEIYSDSNAAAYIALDRNIESRLDFAPSLAAQPTLPQTAQTESGCRSLVRILSQRLHTALQSGRKWGTELVGQNMKKVRWRRQRRIFFFSAAMCECRALNFIFSGESICENFA